MKKVITILLSICTLFCQAQNPVFQWAKNIDGGNYYLDEGHSVMYDALGNVYVAGEFRGTQDFDPGPGTFNLTSVGWPDIFILKLDPFGNLIWVKQMGGTGGGGTALSIEIDKGGNIYTTGFFGGGIDFDPSPGTYTLPAIGMSDIFISKLDNSGNFVWAKSIGDATFSSYYGCRGNAIVSDRLGDVYITGWFTGTNDFDPGPNKFTLTSGIGNNAGFVLKLDASGNFKWVSGLIGGWNCFGYGNALDIDASGNIYTTGILRGITDFDPGPGIYNLNIFPEEAFVLKLDPLGNFIWVKHLGGVMDDEAYGIVLDEEANIYTTGTYRGIADFDPGIGVYNLQTVNNAIFISKMDKDGNFIWAKSIDDTIGSGTGYSIALDGSGNVYTSGAYAGTLDFDPGPGTFTLNGNNTVTANNVGSGANIFISKLDPNGNFLWAGTMCNSGYYGYTGAASIKVDPWNNIYTTGSFILSGDFDPGPGIFNMSCIGVDMFVHKMSQPISTDIKSTSIIGSINIYPNPTSGEFVIVNANPVQNMHCEICNAIGQLVQRNDLNAVESKIILNDKPGVYFVKILDGTKLVKVEKLVKE
jgi:hypothetical protein